MPNVIFVLRVILDVIVFGIGIWVIWVALLSATRTTVLPRGARDPVTRAVFSGVRGVLGLWLRGNLPYEKRDRVLGYYAPLAILCLLPVWLGLVLVGYMLLFWATGVRSLETAFIISGSSLLTLGLASDPSLLHMILTFSEAILGLVLVALLIAYLPTMYGAFSKREAAVSMLDVRAGSPPTVTEMLVRHQRIGKLRDGGMTPLWGAWESLFAEIEESHTSFPALIFFRSPKSNNSWITATGCILDSAAFIRSTVDIPTDPQADLCLRAGYLALRRIADFFSLEYNTDPKYPDDLISIDRVEYDTVCVDLRAAGVPLKVDSEQAWRDFAGWRVNYDAVLLEIAALTEAPYAPWSSDRTQRVALPRKA